MARANAAYYATHDPFRDFTTSPEISQVFGEILGLWAAVTWELIGRPDPVLLVEAGPGRGTLMADALRAIAQRGAGVPGGAAAASDRDVAAAAGDAGGAAAGRDLARRAGHAAGRADAAAGQRVPRRAADPAVRAARRAVDGAVRRRTGGFVECARPPPQPSPARGAGADRFAPSRLRERVGEGAGDRRRTQRTRARHRRAPRHPPCRPRRAPRCSSTTAPNTARPGDSLQALRDGRPADPLRRPGHRRPDRACRLRRLRRGRARRPARQPTARSPRACSSPASACSSAPTGWRARQPPARALRPDRGRPPARRTEPHGPAVQGAGALQPGLPDATRIRGLSRRWTTLRRAAKSLPCRSPPTRSACRMASSRARAASPAGPTPASIAACPAATRATRCWRTAPARPARSAPSRTASSA